jgi:hypothetical protein
MSPTRISAGDGHWRGDPPEPRKKRRVLTRRRGARGGIFLETTERDDRLPPLSRRLRFGLPLLGRGTPDSVAADSALVDADREPFPRAAADVSRDAYAESIFIKSGLRNRRRLVPKPEPGVESLPKTLRVLRASA